MALNLFASFGYFDNPDEDELVLRSVHDSVAIFIFVGKRRKNHDRKK